MLLGLRCHLLRRQILQLLLGGLLRRLLLLLRRAVGSSLHAGLQLGHVRIQQIKLPLDSLQRCSTVHCHSGNRTKAPSWPIHRHKQQAACA